MNFLLCNQRNSSFNTHYYESVKDIPDQVFIDLRCKKELYLNPKYLVALEKNNKQIQFLYIVLSKSKEKFIGFCIIQVIDFHLSSFMDKSLSFFENVNCFVRKFKFLSSEKSLKILICGNTFVTGEHGIMIAKGEDKKSLLKQFVKALSALVNSREDLKKEIDIYMIKDFMNTSLSITNELKKEGFYSLKVAPNMIMKIDSGWKDLNDYLSDLKTKFRVKAKKALLNSSALKIENIQLEKLDELLPEMNKLYKNVLNKAEFNLENFNLSTYKTLKENFEDNYLLKGYWFEKKLVGFMSGMFNGNILDAHFIGINYDENKNLAIYQRMLYDYIEIAIINKVKWLNFGRTASEIKSSVGAFPQEMTIYLRHRKHFSNKILRVFLNKIKLTPFNQKFPFKQK